MFKPYAWVKSLLSGGGKKNKDSLIDTDLKYRNLVENAVIGVYIIQNNLFKYVNKRFCEIFGYTYEDVVEKKGPLDLVYREDIKLVEDNIKRRIESNLKSIEYEFRANRKDGEIIWVKVLGSLIQYQNNTAISGTILDVTHSKRVEEELRISEERLRITLETTQIGIWDWDLENDRWYASPIYYAMLGYKPETGAGDRNKWLNRVHPEDREMVKEKIYQVLNQETTNYIYEARMLHANGSYRWHQVTGHCVGKNHQGKVTRMVGIRRDINDYKLAEENLKKNEGRLRTLIDTIPDLVWLKDPDGIYLKCNRRFELFFGASEKEIIGKTDYDFVDKELADFFRQKDKEAIDAGKPSVNEEQVTFSDGHPEILETIKTPIYEEDGKFIGVLGIGRDITERKNAEAALLKNQILLRDSQRVANIGCWELDIKTKKLYWNEETYRIYGIKNLELQLTFETFNQLVHPEDRWIVRQHFERMIKTKVFLDFECRIIREDGAIRTIMVAGDVELDKKGEVSRTFGIVQDLTERKQTEERLREREIQLRSLTNTIPDLIWLKDPNGIILQCNRRFENFFGALEKEIIGKTDYDFISKELADYFREKDNEAIVEKRATINENEVTFPDGHIEMLETIRTPVYGSDGKLVGILGVGRDITKRKHAEIELKESEELANNLLRLAPYQIFLTDSDLRCILVNDAYYTINNIDRSEVIGRTISEQGFIIDPITQEYIQHELKTKGKVENLEMTVTGRNGEQREHLYSCLVIQWKNKPMVLHSSFDITEKKKVEQELDSYRRHLELLVRKRTDELDASNEELKTINKELLLQKEELQNALNNLNETKNQLIHSEKMASLGILSAGIAHEINNPLNFIQGGIICLDKYLKKHLKDNFDKVAPFINAIYTGVNRASVIVTSLNHYSRQEDLPKMGCDMHLIIDNCLIMLQSQLKGKVEIVKHYTNKPHVILGNEGKLHQAILNILTNAEQSIEGTGNITITTSVVRNKFIITITDTGVGIKTESIEKIFDPFYTTKPPGKGSGLGLSITYKIIQEHDGSIQYESVIGKGTKALVKLPISK